MYQLYFVDLCILTFWICLNLLCISSDSSESVIILDTSSSDSSLQGRADVIDEFLDNAIGGLENKPQADAVSIEEETVPQTDDIRSEIKPEKEKDKPSEATTEEEKSKQVEVKSGKEKTGKKNKLPGDF